MELTDILLAWCVVIVILLWTRREMYEGFIPELFPEITRLIKPKQDVVDFPGPPAGWSTTPAGQLVPGAGARYSNTGVPIFTSWVSGNIGGGSSGSISTVGTVGTVGSGPAPQPGSDVSSIAKALNITTKDASAGLRDGSIVAPKEPATKSARSANMADVHTDTSKFDIKDAIARAGKAFSGESQGDSPGAPPPDVRVAPATQMAFGSVSPAFGGGLPAAAAPARGSAAIAGGATASIAATNLQTNAPIIEQAPIASTFQAPIFVAPAATGSVVGALGAVGGGGGGASYALPAAQPSAQPSGSERPDKRCGPLFSDAKCGVGRCCSTSGYCGGAGEQSCTAAFNNPAFNGPNAPVLAAAPAVCAIDCNKQSVWDSATYWHDNLSDQKGQYVMKAVRGAQSGGNSCDILYEMRLARAPTGTVVKADRRRFTFNNIGNCNWQAIAMGGEQSGPLVR
jgi:hypothetical protein